jgi:N-acetylmuramidase
MNFVGEAKPATAYDIEAAAASIGVPAAAFKAVMAVESSGKGFDDDGRPKALFERHIFYRELRTEPDLQQRAIDEKLAYPKWGQLPYPKGSDAVYEEIERACKIDEDAALCSVSWGLGQIMGTNFLMIGCQSVQDMVEQAKASEANQLMHMAQFIKAAKLDVPLARLDWTAFAKGYNGPGYAANKYDEKLAEHYNSYA